MKRFVLVAALASLLAVALASVAFAAAPALQAGQTFGPGAGSAIHTPGTGLANGTAVAAGPMWQRQQGQATGGTLAPASSAGVGFGMRGGAAWAGQPDEVQTLLGMTEDQIQAERLAGKSLAQIAAKKNVGKEALVNTILTAKKAILDEQVAAGKLAQAQADAAYANMQQQVPVMVDRTEVGPGCSPASGQTTGARMGMGGRWNR